MRLGIDLGGTKTELLVLDGGRQADRRRVATPPDYDATLQTLKDLLAPIPASVPLGMAIPGTETAEGLIKNANSTWLIGRPFRTDLERTLGRPVRLANDANCFALSEATDGAVRDAAVVFGVIAGTGVGGGIVVDGRIVGGAHGVAGEWGHIPLPAMTDAERADSRLCYCGKHDCLETWCSGPALTRLFLKAPLRPSQPQGSETATSVWTAERIAKSEHPAAVAAVSHWLDRMARGLATVSNILDPDVIVLGGGLSNIDRLYRELPPLVERYAFTLGKPPRIVKNMHGDSSGVRGAAWLWPE